ncbi:TonB-dependent receptor [Govanella unica]|uniref:TonB-dependent receptor n=1 Tax=Govanella unica TaxID=2975056 RepID=A0A9X3TYI7_9PROT|nr:TonB-dependent receptor [Govania unica]MDA5193973.1 TonB-dependent receptor [Govania unica]
MSSYPKLGLYITTALSLTIAAGASAQQKAPVKNPDYLEEITVTARLRSENVMDVPVAMSVFNAKTIEEAGINRAEDFMGMIPNVSFVHAQDAGTNFITIRGLTQVRNSESPVAVSIDGVLTVNPIQFTQELFDIESIQVLKGPQGALYGRNAIGGAIVITTKQPTNDFEGFVRLGLGNGGRIKGQGSVSGPIAKDKLLFRVAVSHLQHDGYLNNIFLHDKADPYKDQTGRVLLKWVGSENFAVDFRAGYSKTKGGALNYVVNADYAVGDFVGNPNNISVPIQANVRGIDDRELYDASLKMDLTTEIGTFTSITAWSKSKERSGGDSFPYSSTPADGTQDGTLNVRGISQEIRLTSPDQQRLRYIVGAYGLWTHRNLQLTTGLDLGPGIIIPGININSPINPTVFALWDDSHYRAYALFGQLNFDITEKLELAAALRYDNDRRRQENLSPFLLAPYGIPVGFARKETFDKLQPKVTLTYKAEDNFTLFANYSEGFRSGGFNQPGIAQVAVTAIPPVIGVADIFPKESSRGFEIGLKSRMLDKRVSFNASAFMTKVKGQQYFSFIPALTAQVITSIDKVDIWGFEFDGMFHVVDGFDIFGAFGYTKTEIKKYSNDPSNVGNWAPYVPRYTVNAGAQYRTAVMNDVDFMIRGEYERRGPLQWDPGNFTRNNPINLVRGRVGFEDGTNGWSLIAWAENLFNEKYNADFVIGGFAQRALPRTYGIDFTKKF